MHPSVGRRLARLAPDQRAAATAPPGPSLCIAPAGSGKTTTLVARAAWLIDGGTPPDAIRAITFNKRAAEEMTERLDAAVAPLGVAPGAVRVRTFHALGREILRDAGVRSTRLADRPAILAAVAPWADEAGPAPARHRDLAAEGGARRHRRRGRRGPGRRPVRPRLRRLRGGRRGDRRARLRRPRPPRHRRARGATRPCSHAGAPAAPSCSSTRSRTSTGRSSGWRCCSRRPPTGSSWSATTTSRSTAGGCRRPADPGPGGAPARPPTGRPRGELPLPAPSSSGPSVSSSTTASVRQAIRAGPAATGRLVLAPDPADETVRLERAVRSWPDDGSTRAVLARTNRELLPAVVVALARAAVPGAADRAPVDSPLVDRLLELAARRRSRRTAAHLARPAPPDGCGRPATATRPRSPLGELRARALLGWAVGHPDLEGLRAAIAAIPRPARRAPSRRRALTLATAHATKGLEFDHVVVIGMEAGRFPSAPGRARGGRPGAGVRGGAPARLRGVDPGASLADPAVRPDGPVAVPARGVHAPRSWDSTLRCAHEPAAHARTAGRGWVAIQVVLLVAVVATGLLGPAWDGSVARRDRASSELALVVGGLGLAGARDRRPRRGARTPFPVPRRRCGARRDRACTDSSATRSTAGSSSPRSAGDS